MTSAAAARVRVPTILLVLALGSPASGADGPAPAPDEAAVRALVTRWLEAQNKGDFAAYRALYAPSFHGVRRSGGRTVVLDYDGWLRDRERMFKKGMKVAASDLRVHPDRAFARVTFLQEFSSGTYADRGRKQIDVAVIAGGLAIAREELLESERLPAKAGQKGARPDDDADCPTAKASPFTGAFQGQPGWFVLGESAADAKAIAARALALEADGVEAHPIATTSFEGLKDGLYAVVHGAFVTRAEAQALVDRLKTRKIQAYVKESGPLRSGERLVEIRGIAMRNGKPGSAPLLLTVEDGGEGELTAAPNGQFVTWMSLTGKVRIENHAELPKEHNMTATGSVCLRLTPSTRGRIDVGTLDTTTWSCDR
jgi:ketosteroid isomerase-like protein